MICGIKEGFRVIETSGCKITPGKLCYFKLPTGFLTTVFSIVMNTKVAEVAMAKHTIVAKGELRELQMEFDTLIAKSHLETPAIDALRKFVFL